MNEFNCFHCLIKKISQEKDQKLRIVCDWNDVIQSGLGLLMWSIEEDPELPQAEFFNKFWSSQEEVDSWKKDETKLGKVLKVWLDSDFYNNSPFLTVAKELLLAYQEGLIEELVFLSGYKEKLTPGGDERIINKFRASFGKLPNTSIELIPDTLHKSQWLLEKYSDFDLFIDDTPEKMSRVIESFRNDDKSYAMPYYKCNENVQGVYHVETRVSDLENKKFVLENKELVKLQNKIVNL